MTAQPVSNARRSIFVGRERELARLSAALDDAIKGRGAVVAVTGEPGIGKTWLVQELERQATELGVQFHWGRTPEAGGAPAYWPWVRALRLVTANLDIEPLQPVLGVHVATLTRLLRELGLGESDLPADGDEGAQVRLFDGVTSLLTAVSRTQPLVIVLDDIHWADAASLGLLRYLAPEIAQVPLLLVVTYRGEEVAGNQALRDTTGSLARLGHFEAVELAGLAPDSVRRYLVEANGREPSQVHLSAMVERTQGNPFFLAELAALQIGDAERVTLLSTVTAVVEQRLARISPDCDALLVMAAVAGRSFGLDLLAALTGRGDERLLDLVEEALVAGVLDDGEQVGSYQFHHALVQETLLERLSATRRARLHGQVAEAQEGLYGEQPERAAEIAHHFGAAMPARPAYAGRALEHTRRAAEHASSQFAWVEAYALYERCLVLHEEARDGIEADIAPILVAAADTGWLAGSLDAVQHALAAEKIYRSRGDGAGLATAVSVALANPSLWDGEHFGVAHEALALLGEADPELKASLLKHLVEDAVSHDAYSKGDLNGLLSGAEELVRTRDLPNLEGVLAYAAACQARGCGDLSTAREASRLAHNAYLRADNYPDAGSSLQHVAQSDHWSGNLDAALAGYEVSLSFCELRLPGRAGGAMANIGAIGILRGDQALVARSLKMNRHAEFTGTSSHAGSESWRETARRCSGHRSRASIGHSGLSGIPCISVWHPYADARRTHRRGANMADTVEYRPPRH